MKKFKFYEEVEVFSGGTPSTIQPLYWDGEIPWVSIDDIGDSVKLKLTKRSITVEGLNNSPAQLSKENDILITARGTVGKLVLLSENMSFNQSCFGLRSKNKNINQLYLFYYLKFYVPFLKRMTQGSVFDTINLDTFNLVEISAPSYKKQIKIADFLRGYDNKIENNNKIISELESLSKLIYEYWFIQFDFPDENGKPYKSSGGKMVWNEKLKREIPEGWKVQTLLKNDISEIINGGVENYEGTKEYLATADINENGALNGELLSFEERPNRANMTPVKNSVWVAKMADSPKRLFFTENSNFIDKYIISTGMFAFTSSKEHYEYLMMYLFDDHFERLKNRYAQGATQRAINQGNLNLFPIIIPEQKPLNQFHVFTKDMVRKIEVLKEENKELEKQRDFFLPLLMNGQVTIK